MMHEDTHTPRMLASVLLLAGALITPAVADEGDALDLPGVPPSVTEANDAEDLPEEAEAAIDEAAEQAAGTDVAEGSRTDLSLYPGENKLVAVSHGHPNRIVTPFEDPEVRTAHDVEVDVDDRVIYVTTTQAQPVTLYITPPDDQLQAMSLTLVPREVPPRQLEVSFAGEQEHGYEQRVQPDRAGEWERSNPLRETINRALRTIAAGDIPDGYGLQERVDLAEVPFYCEYGDTEITLLDAQRMDGRNLKVWITGIKNSGDEPFEIRGPECYRQGVLAVAAFPQAELEPGQGTELYIVQRRSDDPDPRERPSTLPPRGEDEPQQPEGQPVPAPGMEAPEESDEAEAE